MTDLSLTIRPERASDADAIERLTERAFGPGRYARTAFRLREGRPPDAALSQVAFVATLLVGSARVTRIRAGGAPALILGPLAVEPLFEGRGIGSALMRAAIGASRGSGAELMLLVGDMPFYGRFGFKPAKPGHLVLPGPVNPARFLVLELVEGALERVKGDVLPERA